jgi:hypothetical protein
VVPGALSCIADLGKSGTHHAERPPRSAHSTDTKKRAKGRPTWRIVAGPTADLDPINLALALDPQTAARVRRANERAWVDTEIPTPSWPVILMGGSDYEHERARKLLGQFK